jgi:hypothetical protein
MRDAKKMFCGKLENSRGTFGGTRIPRGDGVLALALANYNDCTCSAHDPERGNQKEEAQRPRKAPAEAAEAQQRGREKTHTHTTHEGLCCLVLNQLEVDQFEENRKIGNRKAVPPSGQIMTKCGAPNEGASIV